MLGFGSNSISKRLTVMNMLVSGAALLLAGVAFFIYDTVTFRETLVRYLSIQADIIGSNSVSALYFNDPRSAENTLGALKASGHIVFAGIYTPDQKLFAAYWRDNKGQNPPWLPLIPAGQGQVHEYRNGSLILVRNIVF